jgi:hypothetical protein
MGSIIKFVLILIIVLYLINKVGKFFYELFFPNKVGQNTTQSSRKNSSRENPPRKEGKIHVSDEGSSNTEKNFKVGDYVDFEEVD